MVYQLIGVVGGRMSVSDLRVVSVLLAEDVESLTLVCSNKITLPENFKEITFKANDDS